MAFNDAVKLLAKNGKKAVKNGVRNGVNGVVNGATNGNGVKNGVNGFVTPKQAYINQQVAKRAARHGRTRQYKESLANSKKNDNKQTDTKDDKNTSSSKKEKREPTAHPKQMVYPVARGPNEITGDTLLIKCLEYMPPQTTSEYEYTLSYASKKGNVIDSKGNKRFALYMTKKRYQEMFFHDTKVIGTSYRDPRIIAGTDR